MKLNANANQVDPFDGGDVEMEIDECVDSDDEEIASAAILLFGGYYLLSQIIKNIRFVEGNAEVLGREIGC